MIVHSRNGKPLRTRGTTSRYRGSYRIRRSRSQQETTKKKSLSPDKIKNSLKVIENKIKRRKEKLNSLRHRLNEVKNELKQDHARVEKAQNLLAKVKDEIDQLQEEYLKYRKSSDPQNQLKAKNALGKFTKNATTKKNSSEPSRRQKPK